MQETATVVELPFEEFKKDDIAARQDIREHKSVVQATGVYKIKLNDIKFRDGFNVRKKYNGLEELADSIDANGIVTPLTVDILKDGRIYLERGNRRLNALLLLRERYEGNGMYDEFHQRFEFVECFVNGKNVTELDRIKALYTSNHFEPFSPVENSEVVLRLKTYYNYSHEQISKELGMSRQSVDNYAKIAEMPDDVKQALSDNRMSLNTALSVMRKFKDDIERAEEFESILSSNGKNLNSKPSSTPKNSGNIKDDDDLLNGDTSINDGLNNNSDEVKLLNDAMGMLDKATLTADTLKDKNPKEIDDINGLINVAIRNVEQVRDYLIKIQK